MEGRRAGAFRVLSIDVWPALSPTLKITLGCRFLDLVAGGLPGQSEPMTGYELTDLAGEVSLVETNQLVGELAWAGERTPIKSLDYEHENQVPLKCVLGHDRLERLEESRRGQPLRLQVKLWPRFLHSGRTLFGNVSPFPISVPIELWSKVLDQLRQEGHEVFVLRYADTYREQFQAAVGELRDARRYIDMGEYPVAITLCRKAIEMLAVTARAEGTKKEDITKLLKPIVGSQRADIYASVMGSIKKLGNIELHQVVEHGYSRAEALFAVRTGELLAYLLGALLSERRNRVVGNEVPTKPKRRRSR